MYDATQDDRRRDIQAKLRQIPPADWVIDMIAYYRRTGTYRPQDLRRLLGDPNRSVTVGPSADLSSRLSAFMAGKE